MKIVLLEKVAEQEVRVNPDAALTLHAGQDTVELRVVLGSYPKVVPRGPRAQGARQPVFSLDVRRINRPATNRYIVPTECIQLAPHEHVLLARADGLSDTVRLPGIEWTPGKGAALTRTDSSTEVIYGLSCALRALLCPDPIGTKNMPEPPQKSIDHVSFEVTAKVAIGSGAPERLPRPLQLLHALLPSGYQVSLLAADDCDFNTRRLAAYMAVIERLGPLGAPKVNMYGKDRTWPPAA